MCFQESKWSKLCCWSRLPRVPLKELIAPPDSVAGLSGSDGKGKKGREETGGGGMGVIRFRSVSVPRISLPCPCSSPERTTSVANRLCEGPGSGELPAGSQSLVQLPWVASSVYVRSRGPNLLARTMRGLYNASRCVPLAASSDVILSTVLFMSYESRAVPTVHISRLPVA